MFELHPITSTAAAPIGACPDCGQMRYANLVHHCGTLVLRPGQAAAAQQPLVLPFPADVNGTWVGSWPAELPANGVAAA